MQKPSMPEEGKEQLQELNSAQVEHLRERFKTDLYFGAKGILGYNQLDPDAHAALCAFMVHEESNRRMVLMPRGFLKSTICTISDSIRLSCINPNISILIQNEVFDNAAQFLEEIKNQWTKNDMLRWLFPELVPRKTVGPGTDWSKANASITRSTLSRVSTYTASGSGGSPQSQHFEVIKNDDLIGEKARLSDLEMKKSIVWSDAMKPLLDRLDDQMDFYGTRKTLADVYQHVMDKYESKMAVFIREPVEHGKSIFNKFPIEDLYDIMNQTPDVWAYDYMNNPVGAGGLDWGKGMLRQYHMSADGERLVLEDHISGMLIFWNIRECDIVVTADPNSGKKSAPDKAAFVVHAITPRQQIVILQSDSDRWTPDEFIDNLFNACRRWEPRVVGIEDAAQQNTLYYFEKKCMQEQWYYPLQPLQHQNVEKSLRIRTGLDTPLKARRIYVLASMVSLISQIQLHPQLAAHNWDEIDCLAYGPQLYGVGLSSKELKENEEAEELVLGQLGVTGYGRSV